MPKGPTGQRRPSDVIGTAIKVAKIATGEVADESMAGKEYAQRGGDRAPPAPHLASASRPAPAGPRHLVVLGLGLQAGTALARGADAWRLLAS